MSSVISGSISSLSSGDSPVGNVAQSSSTAHNGTDIASLMSSTSSSPTSPQLQSSTLSPNTPSSYRVSTSPADSSVGNSISQIRGASGLATQGQFAQLQQEQPMSEQGQDPIIEGVLSSNPLLIAPNLTNQIGVESPPSIGSSDISSAPNLTMMLTSQQGFDPDHDRFQSHTNPVGSGGSFSGTPSSYNSAASFVSCSSAFSPETEAVPHTVGSTDSTTTTASVPFQNDSQTSNFIPQATFYNFSPQIQSDLNFSNLQSSDFVPGLDGSVPESQTFAGSYPLINPNDCVLQKLLGEIVALNDDSTFESSSSSNPEVQDILQQFM